MEVIALSGEHTNTHTHVQITNPLASSIIFVQYNKTVGVKENESGKTINLIEKVIFTGKRHSIVVEMCGFL